MSCSIPNIDLCIYQGETYEKDFVWRVGGVPVDLTGYTAEAHFRIQREVPETLFEATTANVLILIEPAEGRYGFRFPATMTATMQRCVYDLFLISPTGKRRAQQGGRVVFGGAVTRVQS